MRICEKYIQILEAPKHINVDIKLSKANTFSQIYKGGV